MVKILKVTKQIKSPYGIYANIGDILIYEYGQVFNKKTNTGMALIFHKK